MSESASINVTGMKCGGCENTIKSKLSEIAGVLTVNASHQAKRVDVEFDPEQIDLEEIEDAIMEAGFSVD